MGIQGEGERKTLYKGFSSPLPLGRRRRAPYRAQGTLWEM